MKNIILKSITAIAVIALLAAGCALDAPSDLPIVIFCCSSIWILIFAVANKSKIENF